jgi:hypothetical protein
MRRLITVAFILALAVGAALPVAAATPTPTPTGSPAAPSTPQPTGAPPTTVTAAPELVVPAAAVNVRGGPGTTYPVIGKAAKGQKYSITGKDAAGKWWQIDFGGRAGWISAGLVQASADASSVKTVAAVPGSGKPAVTPSPVPAGPVLPAYQEVVVLSEDTKYPVRAGSVRGWGYELVDKSKNFDLLINRDIFGAVINQIWPDLLRQHPKGLRITFKDADPAVKYAGGFGDAEGGNIAPGACEDTHRDQNNTVWPNDVVDCVITLLSPGPGLSDIAIAAAFLGYGKALSPDFSPVFDQGPYTQLGKAVRDVETGQWRWQDPFLQLASLAPPPTPAPVGAKVTRTPPPPMKGRIAFTQARGGTTDIAVVDAASGSVKVVAENGRQPEMRFDGRIVFNGLVGGQEDLYTVGPDGAGLKQIGVHPEDSYPAWSPDGKSVAFHSSMAEGVDRLFIQWDASRQEEPEHWRVDNGIGLKALRGRYPTWAGNQIAFSGCDAWSRGGDCGLWIMDAGAQKGAGAVHLTKVLEDRSSDALGGTLLFASAAGGNWDVFAIPTTGGKARNLTSSPSQELGATFSPDGNYIAFMSDRGGAWGIWIMESDGANPRLLVKAPQGFGQDWSAERLSWGP